MICIVSFTYGYSRMIGKALFHPVRLALTGRMSGPDVGEQLQLIQTASGVVSNYPVVSLSERVAKLKAFQVADAKARAVAAVVIHTAKAAEAEAAKAAAAAAAAANVVDA